MSATRMIGGVAFAFGDDRLWIQHGTGSNGSEYAVLHVGQELTLHVADTSPESLQKLADAVLELKAWREQQLAQGGESS